MSEFERVGYDVADNNAHFSLSAHTIIGSSGNWKVKLISFSSESTRNSFWKEAIISLKSINDTCKRILPF